MKDKIENREKIEWLNYWIEDANKEKKRIVLIGDSVTRALRKMLNLFMNETYAVDLVAMSYGLLDDMAFGEIKHFFDVMNYQYEYVFFQLGGHHGYHVKCSDCSEEAILYKNKSYEILTFLKERVQKVIVLSYTLENEFNAEGNAIENHNKELIERNDLVRNSAEMAEILFYDLNDRINYKKVTYTDMCHFHEEWYEYIAKLMIADLFPQVVCYDSQRIYTFEDFEDMIFSNKNKVFYVYGDGKRGKLVKDFFERSGKFFFGGFIVSDEYIQFSENAKLLECISPNNVIIIVTPVNTNICKKVSDAGFEFVTLSSMIYSQLEK